jgi:hypothetical protein
MDPFTMALLGSSAASAVGGLLGARASGQAAQAQSQGAMMSALIQAQQAQAAREQQQQFFNTAKAGYDPYSQFGLESTNRLATLMGLRPGAESGALMRQPTIEELQMDPSYAFREQQGMQAVNRSAAAQAGLQSGAALKAAQRFGQGLASEEYGNAYNRFMQNRANQINMLQGGVNTGFGAAQGVGNLATGTGTNIANTMIGAGQAIGSGLENAAQARASGYMGGATALGQALQTMPSNYMAYSMMNRSTPGAGAPRAGVMDYFSSGPFPSTYRTV